VDQETKHAWCHHRHPGLLLTDCCGAAWVGSIRIGGGGSGLSLRGHPRAIWIFIAVVVGMFAIVEGALLAPVIQREAEASSTRQALVAAAAAAQEHVLDRMLTQRTVWLRSHGYV
jgi:hypothetical protein